jgi:acetyl-CoA C-acetyltransferase
MSKKTDVVIAGIGQSLVGEHWGTSLRSMVVKVMREAVADSGNLAPKVLYVGNIFAANLSRQAHLGALLADFAGLTGIETGAIEAGGASGGAALRQGYLAVASGLVDVALVVGVEKVTDMINGSPDTAAMTLVDSDYESAHGMSPVAQAALLTRLYLHEYQVPVDGLAGFPLTAHANGAGNKYAMYRKAIALKDYQKAERVCEPLNLFDVAPSADGAAALVLTRSSLVPADRAYPLVRIAASSIASDTLAVAERGDPLWFNAAQASTEAAFAKAGLTPPQVDLFEYDDRYPVYAALSLEAAGFAERGRGWKLAGDGSITLTGQIPCATMGGSKARGDPGGATGIYQAVEAVLQLRGIAPSNQIADAKYALIQTLGGPAATVVTHLLEREE